MERKEFIKKIGVGAAFAFTFGCMGGCKKFDYGPDPTVGYGNDNEGNASGGNSNLKVDFTLDLTDPANIQLTYKGGYIYVGDVIVVYTEAGDYVSATKICTDENLPEIIWDKGEYLCLEHGATFDTNGAETKTYDDLGTPGIEVYNTSLFGNKLRVYSNT